MRKFLFVASKSPPEEEKDEWRRHKSDNSCGQEEVLKLLTIRSAHQINVICQVCDGDMPECPPTISDAVDKSGPSPRPKTELLITNTYKLRS